MNILILGSGGREHALAWKVRQSPDCKELYIAPGNAGTAREGKNLPHLNPMNFKEVLDTIQSLDIDMVIIGPEAPLVDGLVDYLELHATKELILVGPNKSAARLEGSKDYSKEFMYQNHIPTAKYQSFSLTELDAAISYLKTLTPPFVLKADGLAAGKGVIISPDLDTAIQELKQMLSGKFGKASSKVVIEEFLEGIEFSVFILTDGKGHYVLLPEAKDYKRIGEGDKGPNTGGMGAVSPVNFVDQTMMHLVKKSIIEPTIKGLIDRGIHYQGFLFFGLINHNGNPKVIEYNCRLGDPETEVVLPRLQSDLVALFNDMHAGTLGKKPILYHSEIATTVMLVSEGYPGPYPKGKPIEIPNSDELFFHAGTLLSNEEEILTNGGRVIACTAMGSSLKEALTNSYSMVKRVRFDGKTYRSDIGQDLM